MRISRLTPKDAVWPDALNRLHDPPETLYLRGTLPEGRAVAVVGTRKMTPYGAYAAEMAARTLACLGVTIVSGLAIGIDGRAHTSALKAGGATIAVLGAGVDDAHLYPRLHFRLAQDILKAGYALLSEYPPGTGCRKHHFHARNRIVAGLTEAVLIIEAPKRSGAMMTARLALENGREVWAVPGPITHENAVGPNSLIRDGATPITGPEDIALALNLPLSPREIPLDEEENRLVKAMQDGCDTIDAIASEIDSSPDIVAAAMTRLELKNAARSLGGGRYTLYTAP